MMVLALAINLAVSPVTSNAARGYETVRIVRAHMTSNGGVTGTRIPVDIRVCLLIGLEPTHDDGTALG